MRKYRRYLAGVVCLAAVAIVGPCRFGYNSVCTNCGAIRHTDERELLPLSLPYWTSHSIEVTPLSRVCATTQLVGEHDHTWQFGHGNTYPLWSCSLGKGSSVTGQVMSEQVAAFLKNVAQFGSVNEARKWLRLILDADTSRYVVGALLESQFPETGFENAEEYRNWSAARLKKMDSFVVEMVEFGK